MSLVIRRLTADDAVVYQAIRLRALREHPEAFLSSVEKESGYTDEFVRKRLADKEGREDDLVLAAFRNHTLVGVVGALRSTYRKEHHKAFIWGMYVAPEARRTGVAGLLLDEIIRAISAADGIEQIQLSVITDNTAARELYESRGFETYGTERRAIKIDDRYYDDEYMVLFLDRDQ
jgi:ribosomal protein S18 acetylase RimI-like enzyme